MKRRIGYYLVGLFFISFGVTSIISADLGANPWDALFVAMSRSFGLSVGNWMIIICTLVLFLNALMLQKIPDFPAFATIIIQGFLVDFWLELFFVHFSFEGITTRLFLFVLGFIVLLPGVVLYLQAEFAPNPVDRLMLAINRRFGIPVGVARLGYDLVVLGLAFIFEGPVFFGTVFLAITSGPVIQILQKKFRKIQMKRGIINV